MPSLIAVVLGGCVAADRRLLARGRAAEMGIDGGDGVLLAVPDFLWALVLMLLFGVLMPLLPISGRIDPQLDVSFATSSI